MITSNVNVNDSRSNDSMNLDSTVGIGGDFELFGADDSGFNLPDLIPDSPTLLPNKISNNNSLNPFATSTSTTTTNIPTRPTYVRSDRSTSLPPLSARKGPRRRTLESRDQSSFISTLYNSDRSHSGSSNDSNDGNNPSNIGVGGVLSSSNGKRGGEYFNAHTDSPLTREEQEDLLDRVRRDLLGVDLDTLRGPLRALALSAVYSNQPPPPLSSMTTTATTNYINSANNSNYQDNSGVPPLHPLPAYRSSLTNELDDSVRRTVSPQEAFLDYDSVDHQLNQAAKRENGSFSFGIGTSLFAPLPLTSRSSSPLQPPVASISSLSSSLTSSKPIPISPLSPRLSSSTNTSQDKRRPSHPFSVPKNAVSWADNDQVTGKYSTSLSKNIEGNQDSTGGMIDFRESSEGDEFEGEEEIASNSSRINLGRAPTSSSSTTFTSSGFVPPRHLIPSLNRIQSNQSRQPSIISSEEDSVHSAVTGFTTRRPISSTQNSNQFHPPPGSSSKSIRRTSRTPAPRTDLDLVSLASDSDFSDVDQLVPLGSRSTSSHALQFPQYTSTTSNELLPARLDENPSHLLKKRKRSRIARALSDDDEEDDEGDGEYHSSTSNNSRSTPSTSTSTSRPNTSHTTSNRGRKPNVASHRSTQPTTKRRRGSSKLSSNPLVHSTSSTSNPPPANFVAGKTPAKNPDGTISCPFILESTGQTCGTVFRRPYDLARHRINIHSEIIPGRVGINGNSKGSTEGVLAANGKVIVPGRIDWICFECKGSFSRKDALLRHSRIRGHDAGI